jgi:hypothetical protein
MQELLLKMIDVMTDAECDAIEINKDEIRLLFALLIDQLSVSTVNSLIGQPMFDVVLIPQQKEEKES